MSQIKDCLSVECRLLHDGAGIYVQHYNNFIKLLEQNKSALMRIAVLEQIYHDVRPISLPRVERDVESLLTDVRGIIGRLENLTGADSTDDTSRYLGVILKSLTRNIREELLPVFSPRTDQIVVPLDAIQPGHARVVGNKAANLATLRREMGVATPGGFAVTATACIDFIHDSGLAEFILSEMAGLDPESPSGIDGVSRRIRTRIMAEPLTPRIQRGLEAAVDSLRREGNALRLAVRSSAIGEDSETSFAGQYDLVGAVHDPVEGGRAQQLVVEGVVPFRGVQIAGDDCRPPIVAIRDDVMEVFVLSGAHGLEAEVVDDEQIRLGQRLQLALVSVHGPIRGELAQVSTEFEM